MENQTTVGATWLSGRRALLAHSETPGLDAQLLLCEVTQRERAWLLAHPEEPLERSQSRAYSALLRRYLEGEALPYILGWWEFYGRRFAVDASVLIPRPETELLIEHALAAAAGSQLALDVGAGSGCIAVTLAAEAPNLRVVAVDIDSAALQTTRANARRHQVEDRVDCVCSDLACALDAAFDLICANLPYVPHPALKNLDVARREPRLALNGGEGGLALIRPLLLDLPRLLAPGGRALLEIDPKQKDEVLQLARSISLGADVLPDLAGRDRLLVIEGDGKR
jgi:release factor glutamine methyltransferase